MWTEADWATAFYQGYGFQSIDKVPYHLGEIEFVDRLMVLPLAAEEAG